jgi:large subunit ribosomal protein L31e
MALTVKDGKKEGRSAINRVVIWEYNISIHKSTDGVDFKKYAP